MSGVSSVGRDVLGSIRGVAAYYFAFRISPVDEEVAVIGRCGRALRVLAVLHHFLVLGHGTIVVGDIIHGVFRLVKVDGDCCATGNIIERPVTVFLYRIMIFRSIPINANGVIRLVRAYGHNIASRDARRLEYEIGTVEVFVGVVNRVQLCVWVIGSHEPLRGSIDDRIHIFISRYLIAI